MSNPLVEASQQQRHDALLDLLRKWLLSCSGDMLAVDRQKLIAETQQVVDNNGY